MQVAVTEHFTSDRRKQNKVSISKVETLTRSVNVATPQEKSKFIAKVEKLVRSSQEYRDYVQYLKKEIDMTSCSYFNNITNKNVKKVSIEIHHEPFCLWDLVQIVLEKWIHENKKISHLGIAEEVMKIHYQGRVGLIPISVTVHQLVHNGKILIPLQNVYGSYVAFVKEYEKYIPNEMIDMLEEKMELSLKLRPDDSSILDTNYVYLEVEGFTFPQPVE